MPTHDPIRQLKYLRQTLSQDKKALGFFVSAGCPLSVRMPEGKWPLIPDVKNLTLWINDQLIPKGSKEEADYSRLLTELTKAGKDKENIEDILSFIRGLREVASGGEVRGFSESQLTVLEKVVCMKISEKLEVELPDKSSPYHQLASWIIAIDRSSPIEVFTTNYDLLLEQAFEDCSVPYFDGFVGARNPFFDLRAIEEEKIPMHWTRVWKIHGSINWCEHEITKNVVRLSGKNTSGSHLIYPSHLKYNESRKMPYLALIDQLIRFIKQKTSPVLILSGYSFNDGHLNNAIVNALRSNPTASVISLLYGKLENYSKAIKLAVEEKRPNLSLLAFDEAVIGTVRGRWELDKKAEDFDENNIADVILQFIPDKLDDTRLNVTNLEEKRTLFQLGDFNVFGNLLQTLIGNEQNKLSDEK